MERRGFLGLALSAVGGVAGLLASIPFVRSLWPSAKAHALAEPIEVDLSTLGPGQVGAYSYRGETMLVLRRTPEMLAQLDSMAAHRRDTGTVPDPGYVDAHHRAINPEYLVLRGVCPHLGCVPRLMGAAATVLAVKRIGEARTPGASFSEHHVEDGQELAHAGSERHLRRLTSPTQLVIGEPTQST